MIKRSRTGGGKRLSLIRTTTDRIYMLVDEYVDWISQTKRAGQLCRASLQDKESAGHEQWEDSAQPLGNSPMTLGPVVSFAIGVRWEDAYKRNTRFQAGFSGGPWQDCRRVGASIRSLSDLDGVLFDQPRLWFFHSPGSTLLAHTPMRWRICALMESKMAASCGAGLSFREPRSTTPTKRVRAETNPNEPSSHGGDNVDEQMQFKDVVIARLRLCEERRRARRLPSLLH